MSIAHADNFQEAKAMSLFNPFNLFGKRRENLPEDIAEVNALPMPESYRKELLKRYRKIDERVEKESAAAHDRFLRKLIADTNRRRGLNNPAP
ncbi:MAG: hypothetical protein WC612_06595 [Bdellovibrionales bacterium]|jgi:hypothetical protein